MIKKIFFIAVTFLIVSFNSFAVCVYNQEADALWIYDYTEDLPAGPRQLLFADRLYGWDLVFYDKATDTYTVKANLWIGRDNGTETFFQIGNSNHPQTTLIVEGDVVIYPASPRCVHCLTLGNPDNPSIQAKLLFDNSGGKAHTLRAGSYYRGNSMVPGIGTSGELRVYHGTIAATDPRYPIGRHLYLYLKQITLVAATISDVAGIIGYGANAANSRIENTLFMNADRAFAWGKLKMQGATFRRLKTAFSDSQRYPLAAFLTECRFEDNEVNWNMLAGNLYLVDCEVDPPRKGNFYASRTNAISLADKSSDQENIRPAEMPESISVTSSRHVIFNVRDKNGGPLRDALVEVRCEQDPRIIRSAKTDSTGKTPGRGDTGALLLDEWQETASDTVNQPLRFEYTYSITITPKKGVACLVREHWHSFESWAEEELVLDDLKI